jgi:hypothetical protein
MVSALEMEGNVCCSMEEGSRRVGERTDAADGATDAADEGTPGSAGLWWAYCGWWWWWWCCCCCCCCCRGVWKRH